jgi:hypothetical protein
MKHGILEEPLILTMVYFKPNKRFEILNDLHMYTWHAYKFSISSYH